MVAYTGRYRVAEGKLITQVDTSWNQSWEGTEMRAAVEVAAGGSLRIVGQGTGALDRPGTPWQVTLVQERERQASLPGRSA
jgi:hypothetical protein